MKNYNKLVRDNVPQALKSQGYQEISGRRLKGKEFKDKLCSLFLTDYKQTLTSDKPQQLQVHYADMLEIVRTLMIMTKTNMKQIDFDKNQALSWYVKTSPSKQKLKLARIDLLQKYDELLLMKTEAVRDQLGDILKSFKQLVETHGLSFDKIEEIRRVMFQNLGGYKGIYLESVSLTKTDTRAYST